MKKKIVSLCLVVCLLAVAIIGGTMAYFTDESEVAANVMTVGNVSIVQHEEVGEDPLIPMENTLGEELDNKVVTVENNGNVDAYVRTIIAIEDTNGLSTELHVEINEDLLNHYTLVENVTIDGIKYLVFVIVYPEAVAAGDTSAESLCSVWLDTKLKNNWKDDLGENGTYDILVLSQAVQSEGWATGTTAASALTSAFGKADATNIPTWLSTANN